MLEVLIRHITKLSLANLEKKSKGPQMAVFL